MRIVRTILQQTFVSGIMNTQARPDFYTVGGTLKLTDLSYIPRPADNQLFEAVQQREFCYVLTPRQMGKSSLMIRTADRLSEIGVRSVIVDLTEIGTSEISSEAWYLGQLERIVEDLDIQVDYLNWWEQQKHLPVVKRFTGFLTSVMLQ